ncbi:hypothetical protein HYW76_01890 [Candidatus Pacearchaeota archaeon]|nr:hypothetical protein [Candidatus Pacearchaeota archaeon]
MSELLLVTRPKYDDGTEYLAYYSSLIIKEAEKEGIQVKDFEGKEADKKNVINFIEKKNPKIIFINGHGDENSLCGHGDAIIFSLDNITLLKEKLVYARACSAGAILGANLAERNNGCFIGYKYPFQFWIDEKWSSKPSNDNAAKLYLEPSNEVISSIIKGKTAKESHERSKNMMMKNMKKVLKLGEKKEPGAMGMLQVLWNNFDGQVLHGNPLAKIE